MKLARLGSGPEIFHTIQGEGISAGCPAVFVRTSRCNLHCTWCDTDHTWNFEGTPWEHEKNTKHRKTDVTIVLDPTDVAERVIAFSCPRVVLTGGEPLLQEDDLLKMINHIQRVMLGCIIEVETNGTRIPSPAFARAVDQFNVSPKLSNSGMNESLRINPEALSFFAAEAKAWFKFVITTPADIEEIQTIRSHFMIPASRILLMPEGRTAAELDHNAPWLAGMCRDHGFRYCDRLHVRIWGDRRGV